jgi:hypothetical protein
MKLKKRKRFSSILFILSICLAVLAPVIASGINRQIDQTYQMVIQLPTPEQNQLVDGICEPPIETTTVEKVSRIDTQLQDSTETTIRMNLLFSADQLIRQMPSLMDPSQISEEDSLHRSEVLAFLENEQLHNPQNLVAAAYIFQHGNCPAHYQLANLLAQVAMDAGNTDARWIYAASIDRYLMSMGQPQKYGTQRVLTDGKYELYEVDPSITDEERAAYNVPPLSESLLQVDSTVNKNTFHRKLLESWWLTWISSAYALLAALIALLDSHRNSRFGWLVLILALLFLLLSIAGHYLQIHELQQAIGESQSKQWLWINLGASSLLGVLILYFVIRMIYKRKTLPDLFANNL